LNSPCHHSSLFLPPFLEDFQQVSFFHLHTCVPSICTIFTLLHCFPTLFFLNGLFFIFLLLFICAPHSH
jgi:hypothetical protein